MPVYRCVGCEAFSSVERGAVEPCCFGCRAKLDVSGAPQQVDVAQLERALGLCPVPVLVDFWAPWCGPCASAAPILRALGAKLAGELVVLAVNTERFFQAGEQHEIYALPTLALFEAGEEISRQIGMQPAAHLEGWVQRWMRASPAAEARA